MGCRRLRAPRGPCYGPPEAARVCGLDGIFYDSKEGIAIFPGDFAFFQSLAAAGRHSGKRKLEFTERDMRRRSLAMVGL